MSLDAVHNALKSNSFYQNQDQFWQIMGDICQNQTVLSKSECQHLAIQLNLAIENAPNFQIIRYYVEIIYHLYFMMINQLRGKNSIQKWMALENKDTLKNLHQIYKLLYSMDTPEMPGFGKSRTK
tara:strand:- start:109 stop:483 length:375 start_codon:yes stop_codon:yes gene_type:complete